MDDEGRKLKRLTPDTAEYLKYSTTVLDFLN